MVGMDGSEEDVDVLEEEDEERGQQSGSEEEEGGGKGKESEESSSSSEGQDSGSGDSSDGGSVAGSGGGSASSGSSSDSGGDEEGDKDDDEGEEQEAEEEEEEVEEEEERDLFGADNEEYDQTQVVSPFPIPGYPRIPNNLNRGNSGRNRWQSGNANDRGSFPPLLPLPVSYQQRQNHGSTSGSFMLQQGGQRPGERLVAELKVAKNKDILSRKCPAFQEPCEIGCYSRAADGNVYYDNRCLRPFRRNVLEESGADLNTGFETFVAKREDLECQGFGDLLSSIRNKSIPLDNIHFVTFRNNLNKILGTAYNRIDSWEMGVHKRRGTVYLDVHKLPESTQSEMDRRRCYWGYSFEQLATKDPNGGEREDLCVVDANVEYCAVIRTKLGAHRIIMGAEMDCYDSGRDGRKYYVELKTSRELDAHTIECFERNKLLKYWIQSFLVGVPHIVIGFRDDAGKLLRCQALGTKDITQQVKSKNYWQGGVCLAFADEVLCWLYGTVKENEDYILQFLPSANRLELWQTNSCPAIITNHIEQM